MRAVELWELTAREGIRDTIARYNHAGDSGRYDDMVATFAPNGVLEIVGTSAGRHEGHDALRAFFSGVTGGSSPVASGAGGRKLTVLRHCVTNTLIEVESPTSARARSYFFVLTDIGVDHWGSYRDQLVELDGRWHFARRSVKTDAHADGSFFT